VREFIKKKEMLIPVLVFSFMLAIFAPLEIYLSNKGYFFFPGTDMLAVMGIGFVVLCIACTVILLISKLVGRKFYDIISGMFIGGIIGLYIQGNWDATDYGAWNGDDIDWGAFTTQKLLFIVLWIILFALSVTLSIKKHTMFVKISGYVCGFIGLILIYTTVVLLIGNGGLAKNKEYIATTDGEMQFSKNQNMIILVVDTFDGSAFSKLIEEDEQYKKAFEGFTFYRDTMGAYTSTDMSLPMIVTGEDYKNDKLFGDYLNAAYEESEFIGWLTDNGWEKDIYTDMLVPQNNESIRINNLKQLLRVSSDNKKLMKYMYSMVSFRYLPQPLKKYFTFYPDNLKMELCTFDSEEYEAYAEDNLAFRNLIDSLTAEKEKGVFQLIHIDGSHPPFYYTKDLELSETETSYEEECEAMIRLTERFLDKLRQADIYDNTVIYIMGDHGYYNNRQNPLLLVKGYGEGGDMKTSDIPVSFYDLQDSYIELLEKKCTSDAVFDEFAEGDRKRAVRSVPWNTHLNHDTYGGVMKEYASEKAAYTDDGLGYDGNEFAPPQ